MAKICLSSLYKNLSSGFAKGLPRLRDAWIAERNDTVQLAGPSSEYGVARSKDEATQNLRFAHISAPRVAKPGQNVSQIYYARQGIITPEMEYVALRESMGLEQLRKDPAYKQLLKQHSGKGYGANLPELVTGEFVHSERVTRLFQLILITLN